MSCRPNYWKPSWNYFPAIAYINLGRDGEITTCYAEDNGIPGIFFRQADLRWSISPRLTESEIEVLKDKLAPLFKTILDNTHIDYSSGDAIRKFSAKMREVDYDIQHVCDQFETETEDFCDDESCEYCNQEET